jgi:hypothetical protein
MTVTKGLLARAAAIIWSVSLCLAIVVVFSGCGSDNSAEPSVEWGVFKQVGPQAVKLVGEVDYCLGAPVPKISRATIDYSGHRVGIELFLAKPRDAYTLAACRGVVQAVYKTIKLKRSLAAVELFDASTDPPERRWPD